MQIRAGGGVFGLGNPGGRGGHSDPGNPGGRGGQKTLPSVGRVWIFSGITHFRKGKFCDPNIVTFCLFNYASTHPFNYVIIKWNDTFVKINIEHVLYSHFCTAKMRVKYRLYF